MSHLTTGKKTRKKQSEFQKLWAKAEKLKRENARFRDRIDSIIQRIRTEIGPVEEDAARQQIPLLSRLLVLGRRKSLTQWERRTLDDWIREILEPLQSTGYLSDEIVDEISRYDAFHLGITLDETSEKPLSEQLRTHFEQEEIALKKEEEARRKTMRPDIEEILDQAFGPEPPKPEDQRQQVDDLFQDELEEEQRREYEAYHKERNAAREKLLEETGFLEDEEDDYFDFGFDPFASEQPASERDNGEPAISNVIFKRLFRSTAAQLHPDRERDPHVREKKHALMSKLLDARKQGDVMTVVQMHQEHVGDDATLSKADEKQLLDILKRQIDELRFEREDYSFESQLHQFAYEKFYFNSAKKTDQALKEHIQEIERSASEAGVLALNIKSLKTLKPYLQQRYDDLHINNPLEALEAFFDNMR